MSISRFAFLNIEKMIIHQVFKRDDNKALVPPKLSNDSISLAGFDGLYALQERITEALGSDSYCIEMTVKRDHPDSTYALCNQILDADEDAFITLSQKITDNLADAQKTRREPGGVVVVFTGKVGAQETKYVGIIKAELHGGFGLHEKKSKLDIDYIKNLLLTPQQKLYKIAILVYQGDASAAENRSPQEYDIFVYDHNMTRAETRQAATYFYDDFLGCTFSPSAKKLTQDFFMHTRDFINGLKVGNERKVDLHTSLYTYLKVAQTNVVSVAEYSTRYFDTGLRDEYMRFMQQRKFPLRAVEKDLSNIENKLKKRNVGFSSGVKITAPADVFPELVKIQGKEGGKTIVEIKGEVDHED
jgi:nucleoid-associated protein YejK